jgi:serine/threonine protein kinase
LTLDCSWGSPGETSSSSLRFLKKILEIDPIKRLTAKQILNDPWMKLSDEQIQKVEIFSANEKQKVIDEFEYYNVKKEDGRLNQEDPFLEQMLITTQNSLFKNLSTKSVILAPFNSTKSHISDNFYKHDSIQDIMLSKAAFTFSDKCKEVNRQYMLNNNADLDNGVYNENEEEVKKQEEADAAAKKVSEQTDDLTGLNEVIVSEATKEDLTEEVNFEMLDAEPESLNTS